MLHPSPPICCKFQECPNIEEPQTVPTAIRGFPYKAAAGEGGTGEQNLHSALPTRSMKEE